MKNRADAGLFSDLAEFARRRRADPTRPVTGLEIGQVEEFAADEIALALTLVHPLRQRLEILPA